MTWGAIVAGVIGAGATAYGSHQASKEAKKLKKQQQPLLDQQLANSKMLQPYAQQMMGQGQGNMDIVQAYLRKLASGNRDSTMQALAPEINALTQGQQGSMSAARSLYPRGGATASATAELPYKFQGQVNNLIFGARPQAISALGQLGSNQSSLGLSAAGQGAGLTNNMLQYGLQAQGQMFGQGSAIGQGFSSLIGPYMEWAMTHGQNTGGGSPGLSPNMAYRKTPDSMWGNTQVNADGGGKQMPWGMGGASFGWGTNPSYGNYSSNNNPYSGGK